MKRYNCILLGILLLSSLITSFAQEDLPPFHGVSGSNGNSILIRWSINDYNLWKTANVKGYTIKRVVTERDTGRLSLADQFASTTVLNDSLVPFPESAWIPAVNNTWAPVVAGKLLYSDSLEIAITGQDTTFADVIEYQKHNENRLFFVHYVADQHFNTARGLALGYKDNTAIPGEKYLYLISINDSLPGYGNLSIAVPGEVTPTSDLPVPDTLVGEPGNGRNVIGWSVNELLNKYVSFDIERSWDGMTFAKINARPFVYGEGDFVNSDYAFYTDTSAPNGVPLTYRIIGNTPFKVQGPPSSTIELKARPDKLAIQLVIDSTDGIGGSAQLYWNHLDQMYSEQFVHFQVYRSVENQGPFEPINSQPIASSLRQYEDNKALSAAYYILEGEDLYGHIYRSPPKLIQLADTSAPQTPIGLSANMDFANTVEVVWETNQEPDLLGYRLYRCFVKGGDFIIITDGTQPNNIFVESLDGYVDSDTIYYRVQAIDERGNASAMSEPIGLKRLDRSEPAAPVLYKAMPTPMGVALAWRYSEVEDILRHDLVRKTQNGAGWEILLSIAPYQQDQYQITDTTEATATCYIDSTILERDDYQYQMIAYDESGNVSSSEILLVRPYDSGERGSIQNLQLQGACDETQVLSLLDSMLLADMEMAKLEVNNGDTLSNMLRARIALGLSMAGLIDSSEQADFQTNFTDQEFNNALVPICEAHGDRVEVNNCRTTLQWSYELDGTVNSFQVFRSRKSSGMTLYKALAIEQFYTGSVPDGEQQFAYEDTQIDPAIRYVYQIIAQHADGGFSQISKPLTIVAQ